MALIPEFTTGAVTKSPHVDGNRYRLTQQMILRDDDVPVLTRSFTEDCIVGEEAAVTAKRFAGQMQAAVDEYQASKSALVTATAASDAVCAALAAQVKMPEKEV